MSMLIPNYLYIKANFLVSENLLCDSSSLKLQVLKCNDKRVYFEISDFEISRVGCRLRE